MLRGIQLKALEWKILLNTRCNHNCWILSVILASRLSLKPSIFSLAFPTAFQLKRRYISEPFFFFIVSKYDKIIQEMIHLPVPVGKHRPGYLYRIECCIGC